MIINEDDALVLIIDIQEKLLNAVFNKDIVAKKSDIIAQTASILNLPVFVTEQYPQGLGDTVGNLKMNAECFIKTAFNAVSDENLLEEIKKTGRKQIIVFGIETHICVHQTVSDLIKKCYEVTVISDACGSRSELEYKYGLENMKQNGAKIKTTEMVLFELLKTAKHHNFKEIQALVK